MLYNGINLIYINMSHILWLKTFSKLFQWTFYNMNPQIEGGFYNFQIYFCGKSGLLW